MNVRWGARRNYHRDERKEQTLIQPWSTICQMPLEKERVSLKLCINNKNPPPSWNTELAYRSRRPQIKQYKWVKGWMGFHCTYSSLFSIHYCFFHCLLPSKWNGEALVVLLCASSVFNLIENTLLSPKVVLRTPLDKFYLRRWFLEVSHLTEGVLVLKGLW